MPDEPQAPAVQVTVDQPPPAEAPPPATPAVVVTPPTTDPEVTRLAEQVGTMRAELTETRAQLAGTAVLTVEELAQLQARLTALEETAAAEQDIEEIAVTEEPVAAPSENEAVPLAAKPERGTFLRLFLGR